MMVSFNVIPSRAVSLFTREWIEIPELKMDKVLSVSPSLRGSGLKSAGGYSPSILEIVSLFTREWIEITAAFSSSVFASVSLFTREWIEILNNAASVLPEIASPSLRGSGLKYRSTHLLLQ